MTTRVEGITEERISAYEDFRNGAGPLWCFGSRTIVREGDSAFASVPEVSPTVSPLCNTRWRLYRRQDKGQWQQVQVCPQFNEREPCPLIRLPGGRVLLSTNPATSVRGTLPDGRKTYTADPRLLAFDAMAPEREPDVLKPVWDRAYPFTEHSYRGVAADADTGALLVMQLVPVGEGQEYGQAWSYLNAEGVWARNGLLRFPMRGCYPQIAVHGRAVYVMAISDEVEPVPEWRAHKEAVTGQRWDFDFRQLFFTWTPDIMTHDFSPPLTVATRDETAGHIRNLDLWIDQNGDAHLLFIERNIWHTYTRDRFFPGTPITVALKLVRIRNGRVVHRQTLLESKEDMAASSAQESLVASGLPSVHMEGPTADWAVLHATPDGRLYTLWHQTAGEGSGNCIMAVFPQAGESLRIPLQHPLQRFFTASERAGSDPSYRVDMLGVPAEERVYRYSAFKITPG